MKYEIRKIGMKHLSKGKHFNRQHEPLTFRM